jgi:riboflavin synthase
MFSGIVEAVGRIVAVQPAASDAGEGGVRLTIDAGALELADVAIGDSIAVSGACLTVVDLGDARLHFDVSPETLACTAGLDVPGPVNLEKALAFGARVDGHLVLGHVDGVAVVRRIDAAGENRVVAFEVPAALARYVAVKGSVAVAGVSLTVNRVDGAAFEVNLIPHTLAVTTLGGLEVGARVNLEVDLIARYLERLLAGR